ncbi:MAG: TlpA disulfide reductase family protein [Nitriliruptoraceae bacterium]
MFRRRYGVLIAVALSAAACTSSQDVVEFGDAFLPQPVPSTFDLSAYTDADTPSRDAVLADGGVHAAAAFIRREVADGRPTLVNIFASWCGPCRAEMPLLNDTYRTYNSEIAFLGVAHLDRYDDALDFVEELEVPFASVLDLHGDFAFAVESRGMPTTVVFDADGILIGRVIGELTEASLANLLQSVNVGA